MGSVDWWTDGFLPSGPVLLYYCSGGVRYGTQACPMDMSLYH